MNSLFFFCNHMPLSYTTGQGPLSTCSKSCGLVLRHYGISVDIWLAGLWLI